jgi:AraC-like DNA-binding protein
MRHVQRAVVYMDARGMDTDALLAMGGLKRDQVANGESMVPLEAIESVMQAMSQRHEDPLLGLHMAQDIQPATLGAMGLLLQACSTLSDLLGVAERFNGLMSNIGHTSVVHTPGAFEVRWDCLVGNELIRRHGSEYILGTVVVLTKVLVPGVYGPISVHFKRRRPDNPERVREYFAFFGCPVYFDQPHNGVVAPSAFLQMRLPHGDAVLKELLEAHTQRLLEQRQTQSNVADDVRRLLKGLLLGGVPTKEAVALQLGTSTRSLHRRLAEGGTSYGQLLDEVRLAQAREQLQSPDVPMADIAEKLRFSSPQAFMRWFRQVEGVTPSLYRQGVG